MGSELDVVVPHYGSIELTRHCVESVLAARLALRCIVVDNGGAGEASAAFGPDVTVLSSEQNLGYGAACNRGAAAGDAPLVLFLNNDVFARTGAVERLARFMREQAGHAAAGACLVDPGTDRPQVGFAMRGYPALAQQIAMLVGLERYWPSNPISRRTVMLDFDYGRTQDVETQPAGACLIVRRSEFEAIGGFDEGFFFWFEDVDLLARLRARGPIAYVHDAVFEHVGGASWTKLPRPEVVVHRYSGLLRYFDKHQPLLKRLALRGAVGALAALRAAVLLPVAPARGRAYASVLQMSLRPARARGVRGGPH